MVTARIDDKGRLSIPASVRERLGLERGDVVYLDISNDVLRMAKAINPFDALVDEAIGEVESGQTISIRDFAQSEGLTVEWPPDADE